MIVAAYDSDKWNLQLIQIYLLRKYVFERAGDFQEVNVKKVHYSPSMKASFNMFGKFSAIFIIITLQIIINWNQRVLQKLSTS